MGDINKRVPCPHCESLVASDSRFCSRCGYPLSKKSETLTYTPLQEKILEDSLFFSPGDQFGSRYRIIEEIGRGGMGCVYKAEDKELDITVALKIIRPSYSSNPSFIQSFKKETLLARSITHENVIRIHDLGEVGDVKFISMDFIKGEDLQDLIHTSGCLSVETTIHLFRQICRGLNAAHQKKIVHLDLKPRNIMVDSDGKVYIMDFGLSRSLEAHESGHEKRITGTPPYLSPEQAKGEPVDPRTDIYSLGIIVFEMLTGKRPFEAEDMDGYIAQHLYKRPPHPSKLNPLIPPLLESVILKCLEKDKAKRYQSVDEILHDLEEYKEESRLSIPQIKPKRYWRLAYSLPFLLAILLGIYFLVKPKAVKSPVVPGSGKIPVVVMLFENHTGEEASEEWRMGLPSLIINDLIDSRYVRVLPWDSLYTILEKLDLLGRKVFSSEDLKKVALRGGANHLLYGTYHRAGDWYRVNAYLKNITSGELWNTRLEGKGEAVFLDAADEFTRWVKSRLNITASEIAADQDKGIRDIFTGSPEAVKLYIRGKQSYYQGQYQKSNEILESAVEIDPQFALGYRQMSENYHYLGQVGQAQEYARKALSLEERLSARDRFIVSGWAYTILEESYKKAEKTYLEMLQQFPEDEDANIYLGAIYRNMEEWDLAEEKFEKIFSVNPELATENLLLFLMAKGQYEKVIEFLDSRASNLIVPSENHLRKGTIYLFQRKYDLSRRELEKTLSIEPGLPLAHELMGHLSFLQDDFPKAESYYRTSLGSDSQSSISRFYGRLWLISLSLAQGQYQECQGEISEGIAEAKKIGSESDELAYLTLLAYVKLQMGHLEEAAEAAEQAAQVGVRRDKLGAMRLLGCIKLRMNKSGEAKETALRMKSYLDSLEIPKFMRYYYQLEGMISQHDNHGPAAVEELQRAVSLLSSQYESWDEQAFYFFTLAQAYYGMEKWDQAREQFEKITQLTTGRLLWGDLYAQSFYWLGKIHQKKGEREEAKQDYEKFIRLWKDADSGIQEIEDALIERDKLR